MSGHERLGPGTAGAGGQSRIGAGKVTKFDRVREEDAKRAPGRWSAKGQDVAAHNLGFLEGVCHALDVLQALGFDDAYEAGLAAMFRKSG